MRLFGSKLFGNNIDTSCEYCSNAQKINGIILCKANKEIVNGYCSRFKYNPLMRIPKTTPVFPQYDPKDFEL